MIPFEIERLDHVAIDVTDVARSRQFFAEVLGLREIPRPESFTFGGAWFQVGPEVLHLVVRDGPPARGKHHFALWVSDVHAAARHVEAAGFQVTWDDRYKIPGIDRFFVFDPDGNR